MTDYVCVDLYDSLDGTTYVCAMPECHNGPWHMGIRQGHPAKSCMWFDDDLRRRLHKKYDKESM